MVVTPRFELSTTNKLLVRYKTNRAGFSLIETLLYIALFGLVMAGILGAAYPLFSGTDRLNKAVTAESEAQFVLHKIGWAMNSAKNFLITPSAITITTNHIPSDSIVFSNSARAIMYLSNDINPAKPLTSTRTDFENFTVTDFPGTPHYVSVEFDVNGIHFGPQKFYVYF